ncbi:cellulase family glycosylhydrolase [Flavisolibacter tropicus]|uniref:Membrane or secreted protein n=1 Tax=Flavisolibacter tropicus TaxID=1492898 RepID=A0A172TY95_9BACT|nr:cellulase family glycosylhydrolase [Flavisolibacter tropicus]ANE52081.1 membrane or secreted protein [Flavisolibacter tropicus]
MRLRYLLLFIYTIISTQAFSQSNNLVYVDKQGVMRWRKDNKEAAFFGVNYTVPFAYGYRSVKALGVNQETAIDQDVYHFSRLGLDAFRVHVWDTEISDSLGNLKENEHLRLFDYLVAKLKEKQIKIFLTPLAFWGNGYPEKDVNTGSFSSKWNKQKVLVTEDAIRAQENYLQQFLKHVNPYTKTTYGQDPDIIGLEINNEPHHSGAKQQASDYISRMVKAVRGSGWTKPVFYNISESPSYAGAVANSNIDGVSFQWYPTGLVANHTVKGNHLPNVDVYRIPFGDTIPAFHNKARMVYEFDAGDVWESYMYPAMARSFRTAGFQWATQFAYDPLATAYGNTEYQTHYLNLAYTPSKAISLLIASKAFHQLPRNKSYGAYPVDTVFDVFRVSHQNHLSEMNAESDYYYSNTTTTQPKNASKLQHIAGVGSSPMVMYQGYGAYFLDKLANGVWRLEVMPDAIPIRDPFERASPSKEVVRIQWATQPMEINLTDLGAEFSIQAINEGNQHNATVSGRQVTIRPGVYLITRKGINPASINISQQQRMFVAPLPKYSESYVAHTPFEQLTTGIPTVLAMRLVGVDSADQVSVEMRHSANQWKAVTPKRENAYDYSVAIPNEMLVPGIINYRVIIRKKDGTITVFPGNHKGDPYAWDAYINDSWETNVVAATAPLELFNAKESRQQILLYNPDWRNNAIAYITADETGEVLLRASMSKPEAGQVMGWQYYIGDRINERISDLSSFDHLIIKARTANETPAKARIALINHRAQAFVTYVTLDQTLKEISIPVNSLKQDAMLLLPRPYPGFLPLWFTSKAEGALNLSELERIEICFGHENNEQGGPSSIEVSSIWLQKKN